MTATEYIILVDSQDREMGLAENEIDHVLVAMASADVKITPNPKEVFAYRWITIDHLQLELSTYPERFMPWFEKALIMAKNYHAALNQ
jgi:isopentenyldiphosphate isomerase